MCNIVEKIQDLTDCMDAVDIMLDGEVLEVAKIEGLGIIDDASEARKMIKSKLWFEASEIAERYMNENMLSAPSEITQC